MLRCTGCGSSETIAQIRARHPEAIVCCPEREMVEQCPSCQAKSEAWWNYCAMCGYHIAGGTLEQKASKPEPYSRGCVAGEVPGATCQKPNCDC